MRRFLCMCVLLVLTSACAANFPPRPALTFTPIPTFTLIPTYTPVPFYTTTPYATLGTIALDFIALLCNAQWIDPRGAAYLTQCPLPGADLSRGYAAVIDPLAEGLPAGTPVLLTVLAMAFFLLGLAQALTGRMRLVFAIFGGVILLSASAWAMLILVA